MPTTWAGRLLALQGVVLALLLLRWPLIPSRLPNFDAANFAFALTDFNPAEHKPQPPGYPLYVGLARLIALYFQDVPTVLVLAGLVGSVIGVIALMELAKLFGGGRAAILAGLLLLLHPALWSEGILNPVRSFLAAGSAVVGLFAWKAWEEGSRFCWLLGGFLAVGVVSGFRPGVAVLLLPLLIAAGLRRRTAAAGWAVCAGALLAVASVWVVITAQASGGLSAYLNLLWTYLDEQSESSSLLYGAPLMPAAKMAGRAVIWAAAPAIAWIWAAALGPRTALPDMARRAGVFVLLWAGPPLLFSTLVHSAEPGHVLPVVVPLCFAGGWVLARMAESRLRFTAAAGVAAACSIALFALPPLRVMRPSSIEAIRVEEARVNGALATIEEAGRSGPVVVVASAAASVPWRVLSYYLTGTTVVALHSDPAAAPGGSMGFWMVRRGTLIGEGVRHIELPACGPVVWFVSADSGLPQTHGSTFTRTGGVIVGGAGANAEIRFGDYVFRTPPSCGTISSRR